MPDRSSGAAEAPFALLVEPNARQQILDAGAWLSALNPEAVRNFSEAMDAALPALCSDLAVAFAEGTLLPRPHEQASLVYSRPVYEKIVTAGNKAGRRRGGGGANTWRVYYDLADTDGDNRPDTVRVLAVHHAAARPLSLEDEA